MTFHPTMSTPASPHNRLAAALAEMSSPKADKVNPAFKSRYASLDGILDAVRPVLAKHGLALSQSIWSSDGRVGVKTLVVHSDGFIELGDLSVATKPDTTAQQIGAALTYLRRQSIQAAMGIATDMDDDGNAASATPATAPSWKGASRA